LTEQDPGSSPPQATARSDERDSARPRTEPAEAGTDVRERSDQVTELPDFARWLDQHFAVALSLATFLFVVFQVAKEAGFQINTVVALIKAESLASIVIGVLIAQLTLFVMLLTLVSSYWLLSAAGARRASVDDTATSRRTDIRIVPLLLVIGLLLIGFYTTTWPLFIILMALVVPVVVWAYRHEAGAGGGKVLRWVTIVAIVIVGLLMMARPSIWLPAENISTTDRGLVVGYVVEDQGGWTTILTPTHQLLRERSDAIDGREVCALGSLESRLFNQLWRLRPEEALAAWVHGALPEPLTPPCGNSTV